MSFVEAGCQCVTTLRVVTALHEGLGQKMMTELTSIAIQVKCC